MATTLNAKIKQLSPKRQKKVRARANELIAKEMTLSDLRKALELTQKELSKKLHIKQDGISRLERRSDLLLSTLNGYIEAMGGHLKITAEFPDRQPVILHGIGDISSQENTA